MSGLFGVEERWQDLESGKFQCPNCASERVYRHRRSRNWLRIGVPLVPRDITGEVYECQGCHHTFGEHVITSPPTAALATRVQRLVRAAVIVAILDGDPYEQRTRSVAVNVIRSTGLSHYAIADLDADLRSMDVSRLEADATGLTMDMEVTARESLVRDIGHVATATGELSSANRTMLDHLARALEITPGVVHQILAQLDKEAANIAAFGGTLPTDPPADGTVDDPETGGDESAPVD